MKHLGITFFLTLLIAIFMCAPTSSEACIGQDDLNCNCENELSCMDTICIAGTYYPITINYCLQTPVNNTYIMNPCASPPCSNPLDAVTWIKSICIPIGLQTTPIKDIYNAILCKINLCDTACLVGGGANIPTCNPGPDCNSTLTGVYCHVVSFPNCVQLTGGCIVPCNANNCQQYCFAWWQYCRNGSNCYSCPISICSGSDHNCGGNCITFDCSDLSFTSCCP